MTGAAHPAGIEDTKGSGLLKLVNSGLILAALPCGLWAMIRPFLEAPRYVRVFQEVRVPMPGLTLLAINAYPFVSGLLLIGAVACGAALVVWGHRRQTIVVNFAYLLFSLGWLMVFTIPLKLPMISLESHR